MKYSFSSKSGLTLRPSTKIFRVLKFTYSFFFLFFLLLFKSNQLYVWTTKDVRCCQPSFCGLRVWHALILKLTETSCRHSSVILCIDVADLLQRTHCFIQSQAFIALSHQTQPKKTKSRESVVNPPGSYPGVAAWCGWHPAAHWGEGRRRVGLRLWWAYAASVPYPDREGSRILRGHSRHELLQRVQQAVLRELHLHRSYAHVFTVRPLQVTVQFLIFQSYSHKINSVTLWCRSVERRPVGKKRPVSSAELVLDVDTKTQRVILKKKVQIQEAKKQHDVMQVWERWQKRIFLFSCPEALIIFVSFFHFIFIECIIPTLVSFGLRFMDQLNFWNQRQLSFWMSAIWSLPQACTNSY